MPCLLPAHTRPILGQDEGPVFEGDDMARKQPVKAAPKVVATQPNAITIRGSASWKSWLERFAAKMRVKPTAAIDLALAKLAEQERFEEPPPRI
jgi:hypothetical protein